MQKRRAIQYNTIPARSHNLLAAHNTNSRTAAHPAPDSTAATETVTDFEGKNVGGVFATARVLCSPVTVTMVLGVEACRPFFSILTIKNGEKETKGLRLEVPFQVLTYMYIHKVFGCPASTKQQQHAVIDTIRFTAQQYTCTCECARSNQ